MKSSTQLRAAYGSACAILVAVALASPAAAAKPVHKAPAKTQRPAAALAVSEPVSLPPA